MSANAIALDALKPCPFCGNPLTLKVGRANPSGRCETEGCTAASLPVLNLDDPQRIAAWNRRAALEAEQQPEHCVDVHALLREAVEQKAERAKQLPTEQDCIRMMVQCRLRLLELGWTSGEYAPKDGKEFEGINPGFAGPATYKHLGSGFFIASPGDWWPAPRPLVFRLPTPPKD